MNEKGLVKLLLIVGAVMALIIIVYLVLNSAAPAKANIRLGNKVCTYQQSDGTCLVSSDGYIEIVVENSENNYAQQFYLKSDSEEVPIEESVNFEPNEKNKNIRANFVLNAESQNQNLNFNISLFDSNRKLIDKKPATISTVVPRFDFDITEKESDYTSNFFSFCKSMQKLEISITNRESFDLNHIKLEIDTNTNDVIISGTSLEIISEEAHSNKYAFDFGHVQALSGPNKEITLTAAENKSSTSYIKFNLIWQNNGLDVFLGSKTYSFQYNVCE